MIVNHCDNTLLDNDYFFIDNLRAALNQADSNPTLSLYHKDGKVLVHITPSDIKFKQHIIDNLLAVKKLMGIKIIFSKSLSISKIISFSVEI